MTAGSSVFKAMLGPHFKEGKDLAASQGRGPYSLQLPDDDPAVMRILCLVMHLENEKIPVKMTPEQITEIAELSDKYDCLKALRLAAGLWFEGHIKAMDPERDAKLLSAAYILKHPGLIQAWAIELVMHGTCSAKALASVHTRLPTGTICKFAQGACLSRQTQTDS